jgi:hypothetical protein
MTQTIGDGYAPSLAYELQRELRHSGQHHWCAGDLTKLDDAHTCKNLCHHEPACRVLAEYHQLFYQPPQGPE